MDSIFYYKMDDTELDDNILPVTTRWRSPISAKHKVVIATPTTSGH